jgi:hypothetical protein
MGGAPSSFGARREELSEACPEEDRGLRGTGMRGCLSPSAVSALLHRLNFAVPGTHTDHRGLGDLRPHWIDQNKWWWMNREVWTRTLERTDKTPPFRHRLQRVVLLDQAPCHETVPVHRASRR